MTTYASTACRLPGPGDLPGYRPEYWDDNPGEYVPDSKVSQTLDAINNGMTVLEYCRRMGEEPVTVASLLVEFGVNI